MIDVASKDLATVISILRRLVPEFEVRIIGSRIQGVADGSSDLDLVIMTTTPLSIGIRADLREAFSESDLPFKVDILDWASVNPAYKKLVGSHMIVLKGENAIPTEEPIA